VNVFTVGLNSIPPDVHPFRRPAVPLDSQHLRSMPAQRLGFSHPVHSL
jgi:hypothetical protein